MASQMAALASALVLLGLAGIHVYWAFGGFWPGHDGESLARTVVGGPPGTKLPSPLACLTVSTALLVAAALVLGATGWIAPWMTSAPFLVLAWACAGVFALRGLYGFFDAKVRPASRGSRFERLNVAVYSPLCLGLAAAITLALRV